MPSGPFLDARYSFIKTFWKGETNGCSLEGAPMLNSSSFKTPRLYVEALATHYHQILEKAFAPDQICLGIATIVVCGRRVFDVPQDQDEARKMLSLLSGRRHRIYTAFVLEHEGKKAQKLVETRVKLKVLSLQEREDLAAQCLFGGYLPLTLQNQFLVQEIHGSPTNLIGVPALEIRNAFTGLGL